MIIDPISDMLTRIRNASAVKIPEVVLPFSKLKFDLAKILEREGYLLKAEKLERNYGQIRLALKYNDNGEPLVHRLKRISKPGRRVYSAALELPRIKNDFGIAIISTSRGLMTNKEARKLGVGGEVICEIY